MAKRQLGLVEAFKNAGGTAAAAASAAVAPPAKRPRLSTRSASPAAADPTKGADASDISSNNAQGATLFSAATWRASLSSTAPTPSESDLLALEAHSLDPSWLEHLQEELRKPYFLDLKRFLWSEGLRGTHDRVAGKLKVFPPGASAGPCSFSLVPSSAC